MQQVLVYILTLAIFLVKEIKCEIVTVELCGPDSIISLEPSGRKSSITILLNPINLKKTCKLNITAPPSHLINLQWNDANKELFDNHNFGNHKCGLNVFLSDNTDTAVWKGDPCSRNFLSDIDLLTPELNLIWTPPQFPLAVRERKLVVTAVGQNNFCEGPELHVCSRIGWKPALCVSELLVCDGNLNCPKGSSTSDEDEVLCKSHLNGHSSWQQLATDVIKKLPPGIVNENWLQKQNITDADLNSPPLPFWKELNKIESTTIKVNEVTHHEGVEAVSETFSHYGSLGYVMLLMLICGTILMFCGLWECCFRKPKTQIDLQNQHQPTTVLIINRSQDDGGAQPPNYDDLDQPPSYLTLFPNTKVEDLNITIVTNQPITESAEEELQPNVESETVTMSSISSDTTNDIEVVTDRPRCLVTSV